MKCVRCSSWNDKVKETRHFASGEIIKRRRECLDCGMRFTTYEKLRESKVDIGRIKQDY